jgi:hypothetical protein
MSAPGTPRPESPERQLARLLGSMSADAPRPGAKQATLVALGLATAAVATTGTAGALGAGGLIKLMATGAFCGFVTGGAVLGVRYALSPDPPDRPRATATGAAAPAAATHRPWSGSVPTQPSPSSGEEVAPSAAPRGPQIRPDPRAPEPSGGGDQPLEHRTKAKDSSEVTVLPAVPVSASALREETVLLDRARAAMIAGDPGAGLVTLDRYAAVFPRGALAQEATLLRIKALVMSGDRSQARTLARSFMAARPRDPKIEELRSLLEP